MEQLVYHYIATAPRGAAVTAHWITYVVGGMGKEDVLRVQQTIYRLQRKRGTIYHDAPLGAYLPKNPEDPVPPGRGKTFAPRRPRSERIPGKLRPKLTSAQKRKRYRLWKKQQQQQQAGRQLQEHFDFPTVQPSSTSTTSIAPPALPCSAQTRGSAASNVEPPSVEPPRASPSPPDAAD